MSQMIGYPSQYPSVSMMDWTTGKPNSRYWILFLLHETFHVGDKLVDSSSSNKYVIIITYFILFFETYSNFTVFNYFSTLLYAQGFITPQGKRTLIVNKSNQVTTNNCNNSVIMNFIIIFRS